MKIKSKKIMPVLVVGAISSLIFSCTPKQENNGSDIKVEITFFTNIYDEKTDSADKSSESYMMNSIIAEFNKVYPNIKVKFEKSGQYATINETITKLLPTPNKLPNMAVCYPDYVVNYLSSGQVLKLDDYMNDSGIGFGTKPGATVDEVVKDNDTLKDDFNTNFLEEGQHYEKAGTYSLPWYKNSEALFYNYDLLERELGAGNYNLTNWEDIIKAARALKEKTFKTNWSTKKGDKYVIEEHDVVWEKGQVTPIGYDSLDNMYITFSEMMNVPYGGNVDENKNGHIDKYEAVKFYDGKANQPNEKAFKMIKMLKSWYDEGLFTTSEMLDTKGDGNYGVWNRYTYNQECFIYVNGSKNAWYGSYNTFKGKVLPTPTIDDGMLSGKLNNKTAKSKAMSQGANIVFFNKSEEENKAAWLFYKFLTNKENSATVAKKMSSMPVRTSSYSTATLQEAMSKKDEFVTEPSQSKNYDYLQANVYDIYKQYDANKQTFVAPVSQFSSKTRKAIEAMMKDVLNSDKTGAELDAQIKTLMADAYTAI